MEISELFLLLVPVAVGYVTKVVVDLGVKWPGVPNQLIALGGLFALCLLAFGAAVVFKIDAAWAIAAVVTGYTGGSLQGTFKKPNPVITPETEKKE